MSLQRRIALLTVLLALQLLVVAVIYWPQANRQPVGSPLLSVSADQVEELRLRDGEGKELVLRRGEQGWIVDPAAGSQPADEERVLALLRRVLGLTNERLVSRTAGSHGRLKVGKEQYNRRIELVAGGGMVNSLYLGTGQGQSGLHVRVGQADEVYFAPGLSVFDVPLDPKAWQKPESPPPSTGENEPPPEPRQ